MANLSLYRSSRCHDFLLAQRRMMRKPRLGLKNSSLTLHGEFCGLIGSHYVLLSRKKKEKQTVQLLFLGYFRWAICDRNVFEEMCLRTWPEHRVIKRIFRFPPYLTRDDASMGVIDQSSDATNQRDVTWFDITCLWIACASVDAWCQISVCIMTPRYPCTVPLLRRPSTFARRLHCSRS